MLSGEIEIVTDVELKKALWHDNWIVFFPGGKTDPDYIILKLRPGFEKGYHQGETYRLDFS